MPETTFKISVIPDLLIFKGQTKLIAKLQILNKHNTIKPQTVFGKDTVQVSWWLFIRQGQTRVHHHSTLKFHICISHTTNFWNCSKETGNMKPLNTKLLLSMKSWSKAAKNPNFSHQARAQKALKRTFSGLMVHQKGKQLPFSFKKLQTTSYKGSPSPASCLAHSTKFSFSFHYQKWNHLTVWPKSLLGACDTPRTLVHNKQKKTSPTCNPIFWVGRDL